MTKKKWFVAAFAVGILAPAAALAWWNDDWVERRKISLDASASGVTERIERAPTLVRLHGGVLDFSKVKPDGSDLRFVSGDDRTPLNYHLERFDSTAELGLVWVDVPTVNTSGRSDMWMYYGAADARPVADTGATYDGEQSLAMHFSDGAGVPTDATANGNRVSASTAQLVADGLIAGGARFASNSQIRVAPSDSLAVAAGGRATFSAWLRLNESDAASDGVIITKLSAGGEGTAPRLALVLTQGVPTVRVIDASGAAVEARGSSPLTAGTWAHLAAVADGETVRLYVDGVQAGEVAAALPALAGETVLGSVSGQVAFTGDLDEVGQANAARSASQIAFAARTQGRSAGFVSFAPEAETAESGGDNHFGVLFNALTFDAWIVIGILGVLGLLSFWVMFEKVRQINATVSADRRFKSDFREEMRRGKGPGSIDPALHANSALYRMYEAAQVEVSDQVDANGRLDDKSVAIVRSSLGAQQSTEFQRLNKWMVLLTIAISGGPFLGLLGTVVGVMITFAAIAAAGDVNINAIAPGVAAALLATVAGLAVAIPALFGYNYLITRIQALTADMEVFADEFVTKIAKAHQ